MDHVSYVGLPEGMLFFSRTARNGLIRQNLTHLAPVRLVWVPWSWHMDSKRRRSQGQSWNWLKWRDCSYSFKELDNFSVFHFLKLFFKWPTDPLIVAIFHMQVSIASRYHSVLAIVCWVSWVVYIWLVVDLPLWKIWKSMGRMTSHIWNGK